MGESMVPERFLDAAEEPEQALVPINGYEKYPLVSLREAIGPIKPWLSDADAMIEIARKNCRKPADGLTSDESGAIHLFTMPWLDSSLSKLLNERLRSQNRDSLKPWFPFLKLFLTALYKLPSIEGTVWRGARGNLLHCYEEDQIWWGASSCTETMQQIEQLMGNEGVRTIFAIQCLHAKSIRAHSYSKQENEIILPPGSYLEVTEKSTPSNDVHMIHLQEKIPLHRTIAAPFELPLSTQEQTSMITVVDDSDNASAIDAHIQMGNISLGARNSLSRASITSHTNARRLKTAQSFDSALRAPTKFLDSLRSKLRPKKDSNPENVFYLEAQHAVTVAGGNGQGERFSQLSLPEGVFVDEHRTIYIADCWNHRVVQWKYGAMTGTIVAGGHESDRRIDQLNLPSDVIVDKSNRALIIADQGNRRVTRWLGQQQQVLIDKIDCYSLAMDKHGFLYVSDYRKNEVRRWKEGDLEGTVVAGGHGHGKDRNQLNYPTNIFIGADQSLYVSDTFNDRVMKWTRGASEGVVVAGGNGHGNSLKQLSSPRGVLVDRQGYIYVADCGNDRVMRWREGDAKGSIVDDPKAEGADPLKFPTGLSFDEEGNLYVADQGHHRVRKYEISFE